MATFGEWYQKWRNSLVAQTVESACRQEPHRFFFFFYIVNFVIVSDFKFMFKHIILNLKMKLQTKTCSMENGTKWQILKLQVLILPWTHWVNNNKPSAPTFVGTLKVKVLVTQLCLTLCDSMDCSPTGSSSPCNSPGKNAGAGCHFIL